MIIDCPNCNKKFNIDQNLIPIQGRLLQCGSCEHKWFFKLNIIERENEKEIKIKEKSDDRTNSDNLNELVKEEIDAEKIIQQPKENLNKKEEKDVINKIDKENKKSKINYLNILLVIIISFIAFILILDTFKNQLISIFPNINFLLDNLYQSLVDIKLFILDLIK